MFTKQAVKSALDYTRTTDPTLITAEASPEPRNAPAMKDCSQEYWQTLPAGTTKAVPVSGGLGYLEDHLADDADGIHVDTRFGCSNID